MVEKVNTSDQDLPTMIQMSASASQQMPNEKYIFGADMKKADSDSTLGKSLTSVKDNEQTKMQMSFSEKHEIEQSQIPKINFQLQKQRESVDSKHTMNNISSSEDEDFSDDSDFWSDDYDDESGDEIPPTNKMI